MLFERVDVLATGVLGDKTVVVNGVDVLLFRNSVAETSACTVLEADAPRLVAKGLLDVVPVEDLVVEPAHTTVLSKS